MPKDPSPPAAAFFTLAVKVIPSASANRFVGYQGDTLTVKIAAAPDKGRANRELIAFLSKSLGLPKSAIDLLRGETSHHKLLRLPSAARERLALVIASL